MANLKRRPDKDLNHENWDEDETPEEKGEFKRASEENLRGRRIIKGRRKLANNSEAAPSGPSNPFGSFSFSASAVGATGPSTSGFSFGLPVNSSSVGSSDTAVAVGGTGSLFKIAGITPSSEPPTKASADSSTADTNPPTVATQQATPSASSVEPEVVIVSDSDGITEESSNSSSLPWNVSARQKDDSNAVDSNNLPGTADLNNPSWLDEDLEDKEASAASSEAAAQRQSSRDFINTEQNRVRHPATSSRAPADSSESSSTNNSNHQAGHFNFGGTSFGPTTGSIFQPFQPNNPSSSTGSAPINQSSVVTSPESSGIVRSSLDDDADYENDTTSSSNKLPSEGNDNEMYGDECDGEGREADAGLGIGGGGDANEEREAEGVDS